MRGDDDDDGGGGGGGARQRSAALTVVPFLSRILFPYLTLQRRSADSFI